MPHVSGGYRTTISSDEARVGPTCLLRTICKSAGDRRGLCLVGSESDGDIAPLLVGWPLLQLTLDAGDDLSELAVVERPDEDDAGV